MILFSNGNFHDLSASSVYSVTVPLLGLILQGLGRGTQAPFLPAFDFLCLLSSLSSELNFVLPPLPRLQGVTPLPLTVPDATECSRSNVPFGNNWNQSKNGDNNNNGLSRGHQELYVYHLILSS